MKCAGCYKKNIDGFCPKCRIKLFDGNRVSPILSFETPKADNLEAYQEKTKSLSISGVQLKYSLDLKNKDLILATKGGKYILKPIPPSQQILIPEEAPENEHLTMQIAQRVYTIPTAANALCRFADGAPGYITRRFDLKKDGTKRQQEDFTQISGRTKNTHGEAFKYNGTYEETGKLIRQHVAAFMPVLEQYYKLILFNYLFSNGDAHLRNFSLLRTDYGDYTLAPAYDLMSTVLHTPHESDTALDLYEGDMKDAFYGQYGFLGRPHFEAFAMKIGLIPKRADAILNSLLNRTELVKEMIHESLLTDATKKKYLANYIEKVKRFSVV